MNKVEKTSTQLIDLLPTVEPQSWMTLNQEGKIIDVSKPESLAFINHTRNDPKWNHLRQPGELVAPGIDTKVVVIFGGSGAGKDLVENVIMKKFADDVSQVPTDNFYGPCGKFGADSPKIFFNNYDHPNSIDWQLAKTAIENLKKGHKVNIPIYDFKNHTRESGKSISVLPTKMIVVNGIMAAHELGVLADLFIAVDAPQGIREGRREERDEKERGRKILHIKQQIEETVRPGHALFVQPHIDQAKKFREIGGVPAVVVDNSINVENVEEESLAVVNSAMYLQEVHALLQ